MTKYYKSNYKEIDISVDKSSNVISGEGGGCFAKGTLIRIPTGFICIEKLRKNDYVISYTKTGKLILSKITKVFKHSYKEIDPKGYVVFTVKNEKEETFILPRITANHAIYDIDTNEHKEAFEFEIGDLLEDIYGNHAKIVDISIIPKQEISLNENVYNFEVEPAHTYLVSSSYTSFVLKVHNGGGGKGNADPPQEEPNTLSSDAFLRILEIISEGEIAEINTTYINQVPFYDELLRPNFIGSSIEYRKGLPFQTAMSQFEEVAGVFNSNTDITIANPVTITTIQAEAEIVEVTFQLPEGLTEFNQETGNLTGYFIEYKIEVNGNIVIQNKIEDKTVSPYEFSHRIERPTGTTGTWSFTCTRLTPEEDSFRVKNKIRLSRWVEIQTPQPPLTYPDIALAGINIPASSVGNSIPERVYDVTGLIIPVPINYDPILKTYGNGGVWDGSWKNAWTDNPAWILHELIVNPRWGFQRFFNYTINTNKWAFYDASVFNDELIPDGEGGMQARYTFNAVIKTATSPWQLLQAVASNMAAIVTTNNLNEISIVQDRPDDKTKRAIVTNANVIDGLFTYTTVSSIERKTAINITFNNRFDRYLPEVIAFEDQELIDRYGYNLDDLLAFGVVDEFRARLQNARMRRAEKTQDRVVVFRMALNALRFTVGDVINVLDNDYITNDNTIFRAGRIISSSGETVTFDTDVSLTANDVWTFGTINSERTENIEIDVTIGAAATITELTVPGLPVDDYTQREFYFYKIGVIEPQPYKILTLKKEEDGEYQISALLFDEDKWDVVEQGLIIDEPIFTHIPITKLNPVTGIRVIEDNLNDDDLKTNIMRIVWDFNPKHARYLVTVTRNTGQVTLKAETTRTFIDMENISPGVYNISIIAIGTLGEAANPTLQIYVYGEGTSSLLPPINFRISGTENEVNAEDKLIFNTRNPKLIWEYDKDNAFEDSSLLEYKVLVKHLTEIDSLGFPLTLAEYTVDYIVDNASEIYRGASWIYLYEQIVKDHEIPNRDICLWIHSVDLLKRLSQPLKVTINNPAPGLPEGGAHWRVHTFYATLFDTGQEDLTDLILSAGDTVDFEPERSTWVVQRPAVQFFTGSSVTEPYLQDKYVRSALADNYNNDDINWSETVLLPKDVNPPTNVPQNLTHTEFLKDHGMRDITISWDQYIQGDFRAEVLVVFIKTLHLGHPTIENMYTIIEVNLDSASSFTFTDQFMGEELRVGIAAGRYGVEGLVISQINSPVTDGLICKYVPDQLEVRAPTGGGGGGGGGNSGGSVFFNHWDEGYTKLTPDPGVPQQPSVPSPTPAPTIPTGVVSPFSDKLIQPPTWETIDEVTGTGQELGNIGQDSLSINPPTNLTLEEE